MTILQDFDFGDSNLTDFLNDLLAALVAVLLNIVEAFFALFLDWIFSLIGGNYFTNPAVMLIGMIFLITAYGVRTSGR
jgi:hypothetical protein